MDCDPLARWYRWLEYAAFGRALERRREEFLPTLGEVRRALVLGDGDGRFLTALLRRHSAVQADSVDSSARMLALARQRADRRGGAGRVRFHHADARLWQPPEGVAYDLVATHFFLDCFTTDELAPLVARWAAAATPDAVWIVSEFHQPRHGWQAWRARLWIGALYRLFGLATGLRVRRLPEHGELLAREGFQRERAVTACGGLLVSERWRRRP